MSSPHRGGHDPERGGVVAVRLGGGGHQHLDGPAFGQDLSQGGAGIVDVAGESAVGSVEEGHRILRRPRVWRMRPTLLDAGGREADRIRTGGGRRRRR